MGRGLDGYFYPCGLVRFSSSTGACLAKFPVAHSEWETPLPIPNRAVKPLSADGTWGATPWESRSPPVFLDSGPPLGGLLSFWAGLGPTLEAFGPGERRAGIR